MKRRHLFRTELKYDFGNRRFYISVLALCAVLLIVALPYRNHLIAFGGSTEGKAWLCIFTYAITSEKALLFFPLLVPLATAADIQEELHSRYAWFLINRIGKRNNIWMKSFGVAFTGGAISVSAAGIALVVFIVICRNIPTLNTLQNISEVISITGIGFIRLFLNGALWSLCGSLTAVLTKNKYLSCAVPFILYYVLTVFQERYYRNYFFLSPKQWASPEYYGNGFCLLALLLISSLLVLALRKCVVRRVVA